MVGQYLESAPDEEELLDELLEDELLEDELLDEELLELALPLELLEELEEEAEIIGATAKSTFTGEPELSLRRNAVKRAARELSW